MHWYSQSPVTYLHVRVLHKWIEADKETMVKETKQNPTSILLLSVFNLTGIHTDTCMYTHSTHPDVHAHTQRQTPRHTHTHTDVPTHRENTKRKGYKSVVCTRKIPLWRVGMTQLSNPTPIPSPSGLASPVDKIDNHEHPSLCI